jgi:hypothetical protein
MVDVAMFCGSCGTAAGTDDKFCRKCGGDLSAASLESAPGPKYASPAPPSSVYGNYAPVTRRETTNGLAIASLVLGIIWIYGLGSILALVFGYVAKRQIDQSEGTQKGRGLATAGIILGWVEIALMAAFIVIGVIVFAVGNTSHIGQASACATEKSTIITADEAFKAQNGSYTDTAGLVSAGLLRSTPTYYTIDNLGNVSPTYSGSIAGCS